MKKIESLIIIIGVFVLLWVVASIIDTNVHNDPFSDEYLLFHWWNIFRMGQ